MRHGALRPTIGLDRGRPERPDKGGTLVTNDTAQIVPAPPAARTWFALGLVAVEHSSGAGGLPVVAEAVLPEGASPPLHVHEDLDDSFYIVDGLMVLRCGDEVRVARGGEWVPFPRGVPHTFRVVDGPARILMVHADDSFMALFKEVGRPLRDGDHPTTEGGPTPEQLERAMAAHGISTVGPCMEEPEARALLEGSGALPAAH
jgi:mannose-6-phosphate isomerase-like protein (cupin superfamily)